MLDSLMRQTMPIWLPISVLFPIYLVSMLIRAFLHFKRKQLRNETETPLRREREPVWKNSQDWVPTP